MNKLLLITLSFIFFITILASGETNFLKGMSTDLELTQFKKKDLKDQNIKMYTAFIYTILRNTQEVRIHQMGGAINNEVFVSDDGREAVFEFDTDENGNIIDGTGKLVKDCLNQGSYNFYHYSEQPLGHFSGDMFPWLMWGNCTNDPSTLEQRVNAYMLDFREGYVAALAGNAGYYLPKNFKFSRSGQSEAIGFFLKALEKSDYDLGDIVPEHVSDQGQQEVFFNALEKGFIDLLKKAIEVEDKKS